MCSVDEMKISHFIHRHLNPTEKREVPPASLLLLLLLSRRKWKGTGGGTVRIRGKFFSPFLAKGVFKLRGAGRRRENQ